MLPFVIIPVLLFFRVTSLDATAVSGGDYIAIENQIVTFSPRNTTQALAVSITDDVAVENTESFSLYLSTGGSSKVLIGSPNMTVVRVEDDDGKHQCFIATSC